MDKICDKVIAIDNGQIYLDSATDEIKDKYRIITVTDEQLSSIALEAVLSINKGKFNNSVLVYKNQVNEEFLK